MTDLTATLVRLQLFILEYAPFFVAAWLTLAITTGLIEVLQRKWIDLKSPSSSFFKYRPLYWVWHLLFLGLWRPNGKVPITSTFSRLAFFNLAASMPALVVTSLISMEAVWLRLGLAALFALSLSWFVTTIILRRPGSFQEQRPKAEMALASSVSNGDTPPLQLREFRYLAQVTWQSFIGQLERVVTPLIIGLSLASALIIYVPAYTIHPWLGESSWQGPYLSALLTMPLQLTGGAEVLLASALLVKGASLGTALSIMLVAPGTTFSVIRHLNRPVKVKTTALYLVAIWFVAGSLGVAVDGIQRMFAI